MYCNNCGRENKQSNSFCEGCGTSLVVESDNVAESIVVNNANNGQVDQLNGTLYKIVKIMFIIGGVIVIIGMIIAIFTFFYLVNKFMV